MSILLSILLWIALGAVIGWIASLLLGDRLGLFWCIVVGIAGSFLGGWIAGMLALAGGLLVNLLIAVGGACLLLLLVRLVRRI